MELHHEETEFPKTSVVLRSIGRLLCAAGGHNLVMRFEPERICLECASCGYRSRGWDVRPLTRTPAYPSDYVEGPVIEATRLSAHQQAA